MSRLYPWMERLHHLAVTAVVTALFLAVIYLWPAWWWFEVNKVQVANAQFTQDIPMEVERVIKRPFQGAWLVTVRRWTNKGWEAHCYASGMNNYRQDAKLPD